MERKSIKKQRGIFSENNRIQNGSLLSSKKQKGISGKINDKIYISPYKPSKSKINKDFENKLIKKDLAVLKGV